MKPPTTKESEMEKTLKEIGTPYAEKYMGSGRYTGRLTDAEDFERDPMNHGYVGDMTENEFEAEVERQITFEFGDDDLKAIEDQAKAAARAKGWMVGGINQTDVWFRD
jgi:hypothetical protein